MKKPAMQKNISREHQQLDASGKTPGRLATQVAILLMGKHKVNFQRHLDLGDYVEISNVKELKFTGKKINQRMYYRYTGYPGGLKTEKWQELQQKNPNKLFRQVVYRMLPKNKLRVEMIKRLTFKA